MKYIILLIKDNIIMEKIVIKTSKTKSAIACSFFSNDNFIWSQKKNKKHFRPSCTRFFITKAGWYWYRKRTICQTVFHKPSTYQLVEDLLSKTGFEFKKKRRRRRRKEQLDINQFLDLIWSLKWKGKGIFNRTFTH